MKLRLSSLLAVLALGFATTSAHAVDIYVLGGADNINTPGTSFGKIDLASGVYTQISSALTATGDVRNLAWNPAINAFYVIEGNTKLKTLTTAGVLSSTIGSQFSGKTIYGMAYRQSDSKLYAFDSSNDVYGTINSTTGAWSQLTANIPLYGSSPVGGRMAINQGSLYLIGRSTVNYSDGLFTSLGYTAGSTPTTIANNSIYWYMDLVSDGTSLYGIRANQPGGLTPSIYSINPATGAATFLRNVTGANFPNYVYGAGMMPVPEPSTYALAAIASGVMAYIARRRKAQRARA